METQSPWQQEGTGREPPAEEQGGSQLPAEPLPSQMLPSLPPPLTISTIGGAAASTTPFLLSHAEGGAGGIRNAADGGSEDRGRPFTGAGSPSTAAESTPSSSSATILQLLLELSCGALWRAVQWLLLGPPLSSQRSRSPSPSLVASPLSSAARPAVLQLGAASKGRQVTTAGGSGLSRTISQPVLSPRASRSAAFRDEGAAGSVQAHTAAIATSSTFSRAESFSNLLAGQAPPPLRIEIEGGGMRTSLSSMQLMNRGSRGSKQHTPVTSPVAAAHSTAGATTLAGRVVAASETFLIGRGSSEGAGEGGLPAADGIRSSSSTAAMLRSSSVSGGSSSGSSMLALSHLPPSGSSKAFAADSSIGASYAASTANFNFSGLASSTSSLALSAMPAAVAAAASSLEIAGSPRTHSSAGGSPFLQGAVPPTGAAAAAPAGASSLSQRSLCEHIWSWSKRLARNTSAPSAVRAASQRLASLCHRGRSYWPAALSLAEWTWLLTAVPAKALLRCGLLLLKALELCFCAEHSSTEMLPELSAAHSPPVVKGKITPFPWKGLLLGCLFYLAEHMPWLAVALAYASLLQAYLLETLKNLLYNSRALQEDEQLLQQQLSVFCCPCRRGSAQGSFPIAPPVRALSASSARRRGLLHYQQSLLLLYALALGTRAMAILFSLETLQLEAGPLLLLPRFSHPFHADVWLALPLIAQLLLARHSLPLQGGWVHSCRDIAGLLQGAVQASRAALGECCSRLRLHCKRVASRVGTDSIPSSALAGAGHDAAGDGCRTLCCSEAQSAALPLTVTVTAQDGKGSMSSRAGCAATARTLSQLPLPCLSLADNAECIALHILAWLAFWLTQGRLYRVPCVVSLAACILSGPALYWRLRKGWRREAIGSMC